MRILLSSNSPSAAGTSGVRALLCVCVCVLGQPLNLLRNLLWLKVDEFRDNNPYIFSNIYRYLSFLTVDGVYGGSDAEDGDIRKL